MRRRNAPHLILAVFAFVSPGAAVASAFELELAAAEPSGIARVGEPVSGGIPLPLGQFAKDQAFELIGAGGKAIPLQTCPLVVRKDGTLRWVLLDFQDDFAAGETRRYTLKPAEAKPAPRGGIRIARAGDGSLAVDTGAVAFRVDATEPFALFSEVRATGGEMLVAGGAVTYSRLVGREGWDDTAAWASRQFAAGPPEAIAIVYAGPERVTVEIAGKFNGDPLGVGWRTWVTAWRGASRVHVKHKLTNSNPDRYTLVPVESAAVTLTLPNESRRAAFGTDKAVEVGFPGGPVSLHAGLLAHDLYQDVAGHTLLKRGGETLWKGDGAGHRAGGWLQNGGVFVVDRLFASNPARRLAAGADSITLEYPAPRFEGPPDAKFKRARRVGEPWKGAAKWLFDCSHLSSEYVFDFAPGSDPEQLALMAKARLRVRAAPHWYSDCEALAVGRFGTAEDELASYRKWEWSFDESTRPRAGSDPTAFVAGEDNHDESEADSVQALLLMYVRGGGRGWFDRAEAWARYHMDLQAWRTDGWAWKDGGIWFPRGGPQGNRPKREKWNFGWGQPWGKRAGNADCIDLAGLASAKSCYCHFYGAGLVDWFCLTGDPDALAAAIDNVEQKDNELRHFRKAVPGEYAIPSFRGFGRGFEVAVRVHTGAPQNAMVEELCHLYADLLWNCPQLDERGIHLKRGLPVSRLKGLEDHLAERGLALKTEGGKVVAVGDRGGREWVPRDTGGSWEHIYIQGGAEHYARAFGDDNMRDYAVAFAQMGARYMRSRKCHQTWYYTAFDVESPGAVHDPWAVQHADTKDGQGCQHSGWYTRFYPDACARGFGLSGERVLLDEAAAFWLHGSHRDYQTKTSRPHGEVHLWATHHPPKNDTVLSVSRLFAETARPLPDREPPAAVTDLAVKRLAGGKIEVTFTAPAGDPARYQLKCATLPIVPYEEWDPAKDPGIRRNWWRATNLAGEPKPARSGERERFVIENVPGDATHFAIRSFDAAGNRAPLETERSGSTAR